MISVEEAEDIILARAKSFGQEQLPIQKARGRILAEDLVADRDLPPFNRVCMDGIAIRYQAYAEGIRKFSIKATQAAGDAPIAIDNPGECIEIMTGAALPPSVDTVIRYEDLKIQDGFATILEARVQQYQNVHEQGKDKKRGDVIAFSNQVISPALLGVAASVGARLLTVKKLPKVAVISTGDELVEIDIQPLPYQIRQSNAYTIQASLQEFNLEPTMLHLPDNPSIIREQLLEYLRNFDVILLSGGISMGKYDYVPQVLEELEVQKLFHKVKQRPGKPFWFGEHENGTLVFALPGNPVSTYMCLLRYFIPWLQKSLGIATKPHYAQLTSATVFAPSLHYFLQVSLSMDNQGQLLATPLQGNGSGDFANLVAAHAFLELPADASHFNEGEVYRLWIFCRMPF